VIDAVDVPGTEGSQEGGTAACAAAEIKEDLALDRAEQLTDGIEADLVRRSLDPERPVEPRVARRIAVPTASS